MESHLLRVAFFIGVPSEGSGTLRTLWNALQLIINHLSFLKTNKDRNTYTTDNQHHKLQN